ncbi:MAG TPA: GNAT family N-acetyltransferase [Longimicrobiaceae bacterium]|nr:GNAT family N-acetyltransferase [Longimicrobiaceae bacterium]
MLPVDVAEEPAAALADYASIPIVFEVRSVLDVADSADGSGGWVLTERRLDAPYLKDYDAIPGEHPGGWAERFDTSGWGWLAARVEGRRVGGAAVAFRTPGLPMLEGRDDLAALWDLRVAPEARGRGVGAALFRAAEAWARARGCRQLRVETQNVNVAACRLYARQGCVLASVDRSAYPGLPDEVRLIWHKALPGGTGGLGEMIGA